MCAATGGRHRALPLVVAVLALAMPPRALGVEGGSSNYTPGSYGDFALAVAPEPGLQMRNEVSYYHAHVGETVREGRILEAADLELGTQLLTLTYVPRWTVLGARLAVGGGLPVLFGELSTTPSGSGRSSTDHRAGIGDLWLLPVSLYWTVRDIHLNWREEVIAPTAPYDRNRELNLGLNYWSVDSNLAVTYLYDPTGTEVSLNGGHLVNTENPATRYHSGQELHLDYMLNQYIGDELGIGAQGFYDRQVTGDSGAGAVLGGFEGEVAGIGTAISWMPTLWGRSAALTVKWLDEFYARRRFRGDHVMVSFAIDL